MNRRKFIKNTGILSALSVLPVKLKAKIEPLVGQLNLDSGGFVKSVQGVSEVLPITRSGDVARLFQEGINQVASFEYKEYESDYEAYIRGSA